MSATSISSSVMADWSIRSGSVSNAARFGTWCFLRHWPTRRC